MSDVARSLTVLQYGDSFFPGGAVAFSWGLEGLVADGLISGAADVSRFIGSQLRFRWATADRGILAAAFLGGDDHDSVARADRLQDAMSLPAELRRGSRRAGAALLAVHARLATPGISDYRARVRRGGAPGHLAVAQGLVYRGVGLDLAEAMTVSAHGLCVSLVGAAIRLGLLGHVEAQSLLTGIRASLVELIELPIPSLDEVSSFTPMADIATMHHETQTVRLFSN